MVDGEQAMLCGVDDKSIYFKVLMREDILLAAIPVWDFLFCNQLYFLNMSLFTKDHSKVLLAAKSCLISFSVLDEFFCSE